MFPNKSVLCQVVYECSLLVSADASTERWVAATVATVNNLLFILGAKYVYLHVYVLFIFMYVCMYVNMLMCCECVANVLLMCC